MTGNIVTELKVYSYRYLESLAAKANAFSKIASTKS